MCSAAASVAAAGIATTTRAGPLTRVRPIRLRPIRLRPIRPRPRPIRPRPIRPRPIRPRPSARARSACARARAGARGRPPGPRRRPHDERRRPQRTHRNRIPAPGLDRLGQQVHFRPSRRAEAPVEHFDAVLPDADVDGLRLGRHVGPQLRSAPLGEQLDAQRGPGAASATATGRTMTPTVGAHRRTASPASPRPAVGLPAAPRPARRRSAVAGGRRPASGCTTRMPEPRRDPGHVVERLDEVGRPGSPVSSWVA